MEPKKFFLISIIVLVIVLGALLIYNFFFKDSSEPETTPGGETPARTETAAFNLSHEPVISPAIDHSKKQVKYYRASDGQVFSVDFDGQNKTNISDSILNGFIKGIWSPDTKEIIGIFRQDNQIKKYYYSYRTERSALLDENVAWVSWSPKGDKIAYEYLGANNNNNISVADADGSNWKMIFQTRVPDWQISWVGEKIISLATPPSGLTQGVVYALNPQTNDFSKVLSDYYGLKPLWSPSGEKILFSATEPQGKNLALWISDSRGENKKELVLATLAEKCVWSQSNNRVFCAVPQQIDQNYIWPDDYYKGLVATRDNFYEINFTTGQQIKLFESSNQEFYDATSLLLNESENILFFVNEYDSELYGLKIE